MRGSSELRTILSDVLEGPFALANGPIVALHVTTPPDGNQLGFIYDVVGGRQIRDLSGGDSFTAELVVTPRATAPRS